MINVDYEKIKHSKCRIEDIVDCSKEQHIGFHEGKPVCCKSGPYGYYVQWNGQNKNIGENITIDLKEAIQLFTPIIILNKTTSIREGKYGKYIFNTFLCNSLFICVCFVFGDN